MEEHGTNLDKIDSTLGGIEHIEDYFQLEVLYGEQVYACNVCDNGFDTYRILCSVLQKQALQGSMVW